MEGALGSVEPVPFVPQGAEGQVLVGAAFLVHEQGAFRAGFLGFVIDISAVIDEARFDHGADKSFQGSHPVVFVDFGHGELPSLLREIGHGEVAEAVVPRFLDGYRLNYIDCLVGQVSFTIVYVHINPYRTRFASLLI